jgi:secreted Zn-dependent insulinase-like peptidase
MDIKNTISDNKTHNISAQRDELNPSAEKKALTSNSISKSKISFAATEALKANVLNNPNKYQYLGEIQMPYLAEKAKLYQLDNGQKVVIVPKKGPTVIRTFVKVGSMNETDNIRGLSHYIEHNLFNGSKELKPGEFVDQVTKMGGKYNASTGFLTTDYFIQSPLHTPEDLQKFIKMHADMIQNPHIQKNSLLRKRDLFHQKFKCLEITQTTQP